MNYLHASTCLLFALTLNGCSTISSKTTPSETLSGYTYIPVDPFTVKTYPGNSCNRNTLQSENTVEVSQIPYEQLLKSLPDNAVRTTVETFYANGAVTYGTAKISSAATSYRITVDYINADTTNVDLWIRRTAIPKQTEESDLNYTFTAKPQNISIFDPIDTSKYSSYRYTVTTNQPKDSEINDYSYFSLPVYVGIGLRVTADVNDVKSTANISGLGAIGIEAETGQLKGSLTVQTLGVNGQAIAAALPIQSELNRTTAQNAIVAVASIKALLYEDKTLVQPRVVGLYLPVPGGKTLVNSIISELSSTRVIWERPCVTQPLAKR